MPTDTPNGSLADEIARAQAEEDALHQQWRLGEYVGTPCPNCGRARLCACDNGMHRCEKCNWCPELNDYAPVKRDD